MGVFVDCCGSRQNVGSENERGSIQRERDAVKKENQKNCLGSLSGELDPEAEPKQHTSQTSTSTSKGSHGRCMAGMGIERGGR